MNYSEDHIALAAEYALGTLDADERALVETMMTVDSGFVDLVNAWAIKFAPLHAMVAEVEPPAHVWQNIKAALEGTGDAVAHVPADLADDTADRDTAAYPHDDDDAQDAPSVSDRVFAPLPPRRSTEVHPFDMLPLERSAFNKRGEALSQIEPTEIRPAPEVVDFASRRKGGRAFGVVMTALAASLAGVVALQAYRPDLLPQQLRAKPDVRVVEVKAPAKPAPAQLVALLQQDGGSPAFILTVDTETKNFTVRRVGSPADAGKSYELWLVSDKLQRPRSLGVIGRSDFTIRPTLASYDAETIKSATYAVTLEPEGGSPNGVATGPIVFKGNLIESVPAGADQIPPR